jgi:outer membrane protein
MTSKLVRFFMAVSCAFSLTALTQTTLAQTNSSAASLPAAPGSAATASSPGGTKIATIALYEAVGATNEGQRDLETLSKKIEPKQAELKAQSDELDALKKQLQTQGDKLNDDARATLVRQIDTKQKAFDRSMQDARDDVSAQQQELMQKLLQKMAPVLMKYIKDNGYGLLIDNSKQWPDGPVVMTSDAFDITKPVVEAYNAQSNVPAPAAAPASPKPAGTHPSSGAAKPAAPPVK